MRMLVVSLISVLLLAACSTPKSASTPSLPNATSTNYVPSHPAVSLDNIQPGQSSRSFLASSGEEIRFVLYLPENYNAAEQWPLIIYLHGSNGIGSNIDVVYRLTPTNFVQDLSEFSFIVIAPQLPKGLWPKMFDSINELIDSHTEILSIDTDKIFLTGFSSGGYGTWRYALTHPDRFSAVAPIGSGPTPSADKLVPDDICTLKDLPIWVFHGEADTVASPQGNIEAVKALEECDADVRFTLYPGANHPEAAITAYGDPALYEWFLEQGN